MGAPAPQTTFTVTPGKTLLIVKASPIAFSARRDTDVRTAVTRGLAEYLQQLAITASDGNVYSFKKVDDTWAEPEEDAEYPAACVFSEGEGIYEDSAGFAPTLSPANRVADPADARYVVTPNGFQVDLIAEVRSDNPVARMWLLAMLEDALDPLDTQSGTVLELPHYFNQRATFKLIGSTYDDDPTAAQQRLRVAKVRVRANCPQTRLAFKPQMVIRRQVEVKIS